MSFDQCIINAEKEGRLTKKQAEKLREDYAKTAAELELDYGSHAGEEAARRVFSALELETLEARRRKLIQARIGLELTKKMMNFTNLMNNTDPGEFMILLIEDMAGKFGGSSVAARHLALRGRAHGRFAEGIQAFERDALTRTRNRDLLDEVIDALLGKTNVDPEAKAIADAWSDAAEFLRQRYNAAGGHIGKRQDWGLPQHHDGVAIARAGYKAWRDALVGTPGQRGLLDRNKMVNIATGVRLSDQELELALQDVYESITSNGANKLIPSGTYTNGQSLGRRRADPRFLHFADGDAWRAYQKRFGNGDAFAAMMGHLDLMARDVAAMEILGPNPKASLALLDQTAEKWAKLADARDGRPRLQWSRADRARTKAKQARDMYGIYIGEHNVPYNGPVARGAVATRNVLTSAQLGSAFLYTTSDLVTGRMARRFNGLPAMGMVGDITRLMAPGGKALKTDIARAGLIMDGAANVAAAQARYTGEVFGSGLSDRLADATMRWSLLSPLTQAGRWSFGMEFTAMLAEKRSRSLADLAQGSADEKALARALKRYGLAGSWDTIRATPQLYQPQSGVMFLRPEDIAANPNVPPKEADRLANRVLEMIHTETQMAVPSNSLRTRAAVVGSTNPGTPGGELLRSAGMYKAFASTIVYQMATRVMMEAQERGAIYGVSYLASLTVALTISGALSLQLYELKSGRDPRPMNDPDFLAAAILKGGGLGIFGDFLFSDQNRFGGGFAETLAGPVGGLAGDVLDLGQESARLGLGQDSDAGNALVSILRGATPFSNIWYAQLALHRGIFDTMQTLVDEDAEERFRRRERRRAREFGNEYFWRPGEVLPERAPDLTTALEAPPE